MCELEAVGRCVSWKLYAGVLNFMNVGYRWLSLTAYLRGLLFDGLTRVSALLCRV